MKWNILFLMGLNNMNCRRGIFFSNSKIILRK